MTSFVQGNRNDDRMVPHTSWRFELLGRNRYFPESHTCWRGFHIPDYAQYNLPRPCSNPRPLGFLLPAFVEFFQTLRIQNSSETYTEV